MRPLVLERRVELASPPSRLWPLLADTDRVNRAIDSAPVRYRPITGEGAGSARFVGETRAGGLSLAYEELPFDWTEGREFRVVRRMKSGPLASYSLKWALAPKDEARPDDAGSNVTVCLELVPRFGILRGFLKWQGGRILGRLVALARALDTFASTRAAGENPLAFPRSEANERRLEEALIALRATGVDPGIAGRVADFVRQAADSDLARVRPFDLADAWGEPRREVLRVMLHAVPSGLLELRWSLVCPSCLTGVAEVADLASIPAEGHCQLCDIAFDLELDRAVEATFVPHAGVRVIPSLPFCIGGPGRTPHVLAQANLEPRGIALLRAPREPGRYRVFARGGAVTSIEVEEGAPEVAAFGFEGTALRPADARVRPLGEVRVQNETDAALHVKLERLAYASGAATAHILATVDDFRRLFSGDLLKHGVPLKVARVAVLFSDLTGSTELYTRVGDAAAFRMVDDHFDVLRKAVFAHEGAIVKTMGDAVLAVFVDAAACAEAAATALEAFERFRVAHKYGALIGLKLGMHAGPAYVVTANGQLDYFGQTLNLASRLQHLAHAGELVMAEASFDALPEASRAPFGVARAEAALVKGLDEPIQLVHLQLTGNQGQAMRASAHRPTSMAPPLG